MQPSEIPDDVRSEIDRRLDAIERAEAVTILYACESGSRAWGFASTDSDYDVRFLYVHPRDHYLSIDIATRRDVIEIPIEGVYDIGGWDLPKALRLFAKSNPPLNEWLGSPIVYRERGPIADRLRALAPTAYSPRAQRYHYLSMARGNDRDFLRGPTVRWKKYLYVLRPLLAVRWLEAGLGPVPTPFATLVERTVDDARVRRAIDALLARKTAGREQDVGPRDETLSTFIANELARADDGPLRSPQGSGEKGLSPCALIRLSGSSLAVTRPDRAALDALFRDALAD